MPIRVIYLYLINYIHIDNFGYGKKVHKITHRLLKLGIIVLISQSIMDFSYIQRQ